MTQRVQTLKLCTSSLKACTATITLQNLSFFNDPFWPCSHCSYGFIQFFFNCTICMIIFIILQGDCLYQRICIFNLVYTFIYLFIYVYIWEVLRVKEPFKEAWGSDWDASWTRCPKHVPGRPQGRPGTYWRGYACRLAWELLWVPLDELEEVSRSLLRLLLPWGR